MTEVTVREGAEIAPLYDRSTFNVDAGDFALPKVYICQPLTKSVQDELAKPGDVIVAVGPDDPDAEIVVEFKNPGRGLLFHVLRLDKGLSYSEPGGPLQTWAFGAQDAHPDAWTTYTYTVAIPEVDQFMPAKFLLTKSNQGTARRINVVLGKTLERGGNLYDTAFRLTTAPRSNDKGHKWHVAVVKVDEATDEGLTVAESLSDMVNTLPSPTTVTAPSEAPSI